MLAEANDKFSLGSFGADLGAPTFWVVLVYGLVIDLQNFGVDQNYVQRYHTSRSDAEARKSVWLGSLLYVPLSALSRGSHSLRSRLGRQGRTPRARKRVRLYQQHLCSDVVGRKSLLALPGPRVFEP